MGWFNSDLPGHEGYVIGYTTRDVQTVGVFPESLRDELRLRLALHGVQRVTDLGYMLNYDSLTVPHDGTEALRRMATWVVSEDCSNVPELWQNIIGAPERT